MHYLCDNRLILLVISFFINILIVKSFGDSVENFCKIKLKFQNINHEIGNYSVLINSKKQILFDEIHRNVEGFVSLDLPLSAIDFNEGNHSIAIYSRDSQLSLIDLQNIFIESNDLEKCGQQLDENPTVVQRASPSGHSIGLQYSVWQTFGAFAQNKIRKNGGKPQTLEQIVQRGGAIKDYFTHGVTEADAAHFLYHVEPKNGFYCLYKKRPNETHGVVEDCADVDKTFARHAEMFVQSGVDYIYVDLTNICGKNPQEDGIQRRPMELLFEEWHKLRQQKKQTPQIVAWHRIAEPGCITWKDYLNLYNQYPDLVWKDHKTGKKVFMSTKTSDENIKNQIESNGGKNDVIVVHNWVGSPEEADKGLWQFMGRCGAQQHKVSTVIATRSSCDQAVTRNSPIGDMISVGVSYQLNYASAAFGSTGSYYGLTFLLQWDTALRINPQTIAISGWNEFVAQPQKNPYGGQTRSVGSDGVKDNRLFVDGWGAFRSRDIEPTVEYGDMYYNIMQSCIRVRNLNIHNNRHDCSVVNEICCKLNDHKQFVEINSFIKKDNTDYILVNNPAEKKTISVEYREICAFNAAGGGAEFCAGGNATDPLIGLSGPFVMFNKMGTNRKALYRCKNGDKHFFSTVDNCEGAVKEEVLGYVSTKKDSLFARSLKRCVTPAGHRYHSLDGTCHPNDKCENPCELGFVV